MEPEGGSPELSEGRTEMARRLLVLHSVLLTLQDSVDLCLAWCENAVLSKKHDLSKDFPGEHRVLLVR